MSLTVLATPLSGRPLAVLGMNCRHILLYNLGLQQLYGGHPSAAFDSFLEVVQVYHANPRLWLRLAESCLAAHAKVSHDEYYHCNSHYVVDFFFFFQSSREQGHGIKNKSETIRKVFGSGIHRKLVLAPIQHWSKRGRYTIIRSRIHL